VRALLCAEEAEPRQWHHRVHARHEGLALRLHLLVQAVVRNQVHVPVGMREG
jgi:hypothetical protein